MEPELFDCSWCGSARSVDHGICQVCMMEYPVKTQVFSLPDARRAAVRRSKPLIEKSVGDLPAALPAQGASTAEPA